MQKEIGGGGVAINKNQSPIIMIFSGHACRHPIEKPTKSIPPIISKEKEKDFTGPSTNYAKFPPPPPPAKEQPERSLASVASVVTHTRRLPFNLLSSHKHNADRDNHHFGHKRNDSANSLASRIN